MNLMAILRSGLIAFLKYDPFRKYDEVPNDDNMDLPESDCGPYIDGTIYIRPVLII